MPHDRQKADGIREVDMTQTRGILLASIVFGLAWGVDPAAAQKKYDLGATDTEIKIGNIMPYSGPLSAYALIGRTQDAFFKKLNAEGGINGRKINFISYDDNEASPKFAAQAIRKAAEIGWKPVQFLASISNSVGSVLKTAGREDVKDILTTKYLYAP